MREIVVISGKGGTGKTSLLASFAILAQNAVLADCDVDAADLHLILEPTVIEKHDFRSGQEVFINQEACTSCGACLNLCRFGAIKEVVNEQGYCQYEIDPIACEGCGVCVCFCPKAAVDARARLCGAWMISETRAGLMVHAQLGIAAENSGKLVAKVRQKARQIAKKKHNDIILVDGPPGIGCPVIASISGASQVLVVTEPTLSGAHDLERVLSLTKHFGIPTSVCVNKWDINPRLTEEIEHLALSSGAMNAGRIRYDESITKAQVQSRAVVETDAPCADDIRKVWSNLLQHQTEEEPST